MPQRDPQTTDVPSDNVVPESKSLVISVKPEPVSCLYSQPARGGHSSLSGEGRTGADLQSDQNEDVMLYLTEPVAETVEN